MDFICFSASNERNYAVSIADVVHILPDPNITTVPGTLPQIIGITMFRNELVPVIDLSLMYSGIASDSTMVIILDSTHRIGILVTDIREVVRDSIPGDCDFIDVHDFERSVTTTPQGNESNIELF